MLITHKLDNYQLIAILAGKDSPDLMSLTRLRNLIRKFKENKISVDVLSYVDLSFKEDLRPYIQEERRKQKEWIRTFSYVNELLKQGNILHVFIKILRHPFAIMSDIDVLPLNISEELKALEILYHEGFLFYRVRILEHPLRSLPLKVCARRENRGIFVDFYPKPVWTRKRVHDNEIIISRRQISEIHGVKAYVPSPEDDLYLVATHSYNDLKIPLAAVLHGLEVISSKFDWEYLFNLAQSYGTLDAIYLYLRVLESYSAKYRDENIVPQDVFESYERHRICKSIKKWFEKTYMRRLNFPIAIPVRIAGILSSFYHCSTLLGSAPFSDLVYDFLSHYYTPLALRFNELRRKSENE